MNLPQRHGTTKKSRGQGIADGDFVSAAPGVARQSLCGSKRETGQQISSEKGLITYIPLGCRGGSPSRKPSVRLADFPHSSYPTEVDRLRAFRRTYYREWRRLNRGANRILQQKYLDLHPWQKIYKGIKTRCNNPNDKNYAYYGARGIKCLVTLVDVKFLWYRDHAEQLSHPSIDRINPRGHYTVANCRFIEHAENSRRATLRKKRQRNVRLAAHTPLRRGEGEWATTAANGQGSASGCPLSPWRWPLGRRQER